LAGVRVRSEECCHCCALVSHVVPVESSKHVERSNLDATFWSEIAVAGLFVRVVVLFVFPGITNARRYIQMPQRDGQHDADQRRRKMCFPRNPGLDR
jgi:hypothetical protein